MIDPTRLSTPPPPTCHNFVHTSPNIEQEEEIDPIPVIVQLNRERKENRGGETSTSQICRAIHPEQAYPHN
jgi:hypothetical protein